MYLVTRNKINILLFLFAILMLSSCVTGPEDCGKNIANVLDIGFSGPSIIHEPYLEGYDVSMTIERENPDELAIACFVVRDEDKWYKLFWAVDDVLATNAIVFQRGENSRILEGHFALWKPANSYEICGIGVPSEYDGCSGESDPVIYLQVIDSSGLTSKKSSKRTIRLE